MISSVQIDATALLKIVKHCTDRQSYVTGQLLGVDVDNVLHVTSSFPFLSKSSDETEEQAAEAADYQLSMLRSLRALHYDANTIGWYQSSYLGSFWNQTLIESQYNYQKSLPHAVILVFDSTKINHGTLGVSALHLTQQFMKLYEEKKFTMEEIQKSGLNHNDIFESLPVSVKSSGVLNHFMSHLEVDCQKLPEVLGDEFKALSLSVTGVLEKNVEYLCETIDEYGQEQWRWHGWHRNVQKEQQKLHVNAQKKKQKPEDSISPALQRLLANEPSRLESMVVLNQIDTYASQIQELAKANQLRSSVFL
jgi:translation initiation factor 3 subunit H